MRDVYFDVPVGESLNIDLRKHITTLKNIIFIKLRGTCESKYRGNNCWGENGVSMEERTSQFRNGTNLVTPETCQYVHINNTGKTTFSGLLIIF